MLQVHPRLSATFFVSHAMPACLRCRVTFQPEGFYAINHAGRGAYFFSNRDLSAIQAENPDGRFYVVDFIPETKSTQRRSYVGIDAEQEASLGCYHLIFSRSSALSVGYDELSL